MSTLRFITLVVVHVFVGLVLAAAAGYGLEHWLGSLNVQRDDIAAICGMVGILLGVVVLFVFCWILDRFDL